MARNYRRDSNGRFSSGGGGGGGGGRSKAAASLKASSGSKSAATRAANTARAGELRAKGTTALGGRIGAKGFAGGKGAQQRAGGLRSSGATRASGMAFAVGRSGGQSGARKAATTSAVKKMARAKSRGTKPPAKTNKAPANPVKERYRQLSSAARKSSPYRSAAENRAAAGARRSLEAMIKTRGVSRRRKG